MDKTISVIIPCYKYAHYLKECLESVIAQTYPPKEIIVVNDSSPDIDEQLVIVKEVREKTDIRIDIVGTIVNSGLASARNLGISEATSEYIMALDSDDKLTPGAIEEHMKLIEDDMTLAQCALYEFGERHVTMTPTTPTGLERIMQSNTIFCNAVFSKRMWKEVGGFDESETMRLGYEDWEFWIRLLNAGVHVRTSDFIALRYRVHEGQMTQSTSHPNRQKLYEYIYNKHKDLYESRNLTIVGYK